jgi:glycosyltransferase involved in cell wall biosynthesis
MLEGKRVAVVVPAHDEEKLIGETVRGIPEFVDRVYIVDDRSTDGTVAAVRAIEDPRVALIEHERNLGVGGAILTGYKQARDDRMDVTAVMAADAQMDPDDLETLAGAVARGEVDYAKANRLFTGQAWEVIPRYRYLGNAVLSLLTKIASGYWHVADSQSGYTAISLQYLDLLDLDRIYERYGFPNDLLVHLNVWNARVRDYPSRPIYGVGERSGIRLRKVVPTISWLLFKGFFWRMREKYVIRDFHPLVLFYALGLLATLLGPRSGREGDIGLQGVAGSDRHHHLQVEGRADPGNSHKSAIDEAAMVAACLATLARARYMTRRALEPGLLVDSE